jgi:predicted branched-subunit amino acid permease
MPNAQPAPQRRALATFLAGLPSLGLSESGRRNVAARFGLTDEQLAAALATAQQRKGGQP